MMISQLLLACALAIVITGSLKPILAPAGISGLSASAALSTLIVASFFGAEAFAVVSALFGAVLLGEMRYLKGTFRALLSGMVCAALITAAVIFYPGYTLAFGAFAAVIGSLVGKYKRAACAAPLIGAAMSCGALYFLRAQGIPFDHIAAINGFAANILAGALMSGLCELNRKRVLRTRYGN